MIGTPRLSLGNLLLSQVERQSKEYVAPPNMGTGAGNALWSALNGGVPAADTLPPRPAGLRMSIDTSSFAPARPAQGGGGAKMWLGVLSDALSGAVGGQPLYAQSQMQMRREDADHQRRMAEQASQRQADRDEWMWREKWKRDNPDDQFTQYMRSAGIDPSSPQGQALYRQRAESIAAPPLMAVDGYDAAGNRTKTFMPRPGVGDSVQPAATGPAPGTVRNGYRFNGGNPNDRNSWVPVGSAPSTGGATFR